MDLVERVLRGFLPFLSLLLVIEAQDTTTFDFACSRLTGLCQTGTCAVETQACECPADGNTYNYDCTASTATGYCESTDVYGANCDIPRVYIACVPGKMFINVLTHGGTAKFTNGLIYVSDKQSEASCQFTLGTTQVYQDKAIDYGFLYPDSMEGYYIELDNTDVICGDAVVSNEAADGDTPASTLYTRTFKIQYNQYITNSLDQLLTASCREIQGATQVSTGIGQVITNDDSDLKQVNVENEVGIVGLEMLDSNYQPMEATIALGTEIVLRFTLGTGNDYTDLWLSGCKANNTLASDDPDFRSIDIIDDNGCPADGSVGIFKTFPQKEDASDGSKIVLMSIGAFRFTGSSDQVGFLCDINLCDTTNAADCATPTCAGYTSPTLEVVDETDTTTPDETVALSATIAASDPNPLGLADSVILTCTAAGGTAPYQYYIREVGNTDAVTYGDTNTLVVSGVTAAGTKSYECLVQDAVPATATSAVPVSLEYVDTLTVGISQSPEGDALINTNVEITCKAAGGTGPYTLSLSKDDAAVSSTFPYVATSATVISNRYKCSGTDTGNNNEIAESTEITLNFINPPTVQLAADQANPVPENTDVVVTYTAAVGTAPYTAQWLVDDVEAAGQTGTSYTVTYQAGATVKVTVRITDAASQVVTEDYTVEFADAQAPTALSATIATTSLNPLSLTEAVTLTCTAAGGTAPYQYYFREVGNTDVETFGPTNTFEIATGAAAGTKSYECLVQDAVQATATSTVPVSLVYVDALTAQAYADPASPVEVGTTVTLTCKAAGSANALTYSWSKDGTVDFQTTASFDETVTDAATHTYVCTVSDATAVVTATAPDLLIEFTAPALSVQLAADQANPVPETTDAVITYTATGGTAPYTAQWFVDDVEAAGQTATQYTVTYQAGATVKVTVRITDATSQVATADYTVEFAGTTAPAALSATITTTSLNPLSLSEAVTLTCTAAGGTAPYQYYIREVGNTDAETFSATNTLPIPNAVTAGTKSYECVVQDAAPATATSTEPVSLEYVDTLTAATYADPPSPVAVNTPVTLTCKVAGNANTVTYQWTKDTVNVGTDATFVDTVTTAATHSYVCIVTDTVDTSITVSTTALAIEFTAARKRRSASLRRSKRDTADHDSVSTVISVYDPKAGTTDGQVEPVKETDCYDQSDVVIVVIILSVAVVLLLVLSAILGMMLMRSRKRVAHYDHKMGDYGYPTQTLAMPRLEISSGAGSSSGGYSNRAI